ncbi:MAG: DUF4296 domain-containing protein [Bacteroidales bacterium]|nr:DUF4296 domain-containing protein [Bacteroidales bacterium]
MNDFRSKTVVAAAVAVIAACVGCNRVPSHVIEPERMARLMADMRMADAVITLNPGDYRSDSSRVILKRAVFDRNGVTQADFDTSLIWYGHNIDRYQEINDRTIEILEGRLADIGAAGGTGNALSVAGDSVDVWPGAMSYVISRRSPSDFITFGMESDRNWEQGDVYTWSFKFATMPASARWGISAEYDDGSVETLTSMITVGGSVRQTISFLTDSTRSARYIGGWLYVEPDGHRPVFIDSVSLTRGRLDGHKQSRHYMQRMVSPRGVKDPGQNDSVSD